MSNLIIDLHGTKRSVLENIGRDFDADIERLEESTKIDSVIYSRMNEGYDGFIIVTSDVKGAQKYFENRYNNVDIAVCSPDGRMQLREVATVQTGGVNAGGTTTTINTQQTAQPNQQAAPQPKTEKFYTFDIGSGNSIDLTHLQHIYIVPVRFNAYGPKKSKEGIQKLSQYIQAAVNGYNKTAYFCFVFYRNRDNDGPFLPSTIMSLVNHYSDENFEKIWAKGIAAESAYSSYNDMLYTDAEALKNAYFNKHQITIGMRGKPLPKNIVVKVLPEVSDGCDCRADIVKLSRSVISEINGMKEGDIKKKLSSDEYKKVQEEVNKSKNPHKNDLGYYLQYLDHDLKVQTKNGAFEGKEKQKDFETALDAVKMIKDMTIGNQFDKLGQDVKEDTVAGVFIAAAEAGKKFYDKHKNDMKKDSNDISTSNSGANANAKWYCAKDSLKLCQLLGLV